MAVSFTLKKLVCLENFIFFTFQRKIIMIKNTISVMLCQGAGREGCSIQPSSESKALMGSAAPTRVQSHSTQSSRAQPAQGSPGRSGVMLGSQVHRSGPDQQVDGWA